MFDNDLIENESWIFQGIWVLKIWVKL
jgi:hypothetical protein